MKKRLKKEAKDEIVARVKSGELTKAEAAKKYGWSPAAVHRWVMEDDSRSFARFSDKELVDELRERGYTVTATKQVDL